MGKPTEEKNSPAGAAVTLKRLELKPVETDNPDTLRILKQTGQACERLNNYLLDFRETIAILNENLQARAGNGDRAGAGEAEESIAFVRTRVDEVLKDMEAIARDMAFLVELKEG